MGILAAFDRSLETLTTAADLRAKRQGAISANVANADTPGYQAVDVSFADALNRARGRGGLSLARTHASHLSSAQPQGRAADTVVLSGGTSRQDGNNVNIDQEMAKLARNQIEYQFFAQRLAGKFRKMKEAITGRTNP